MKEVLLECAKSAGRLLLNSFGKTTDVRHKGDRANVVTEADLASERLIIERIRERFPDHSILAEETGYARGTSEFTWVIDPLDGTSNFAAGLPWFGVQIAVLQRAQPILAVMYLPVEDALYFAERGQGAFRNDSRVRVTAETDPRNVLCNFGLDASGDDAQTRRNIELLFRVVSAVRNVRATNSLVDLCYTVDGRLGGCINVNAKIWDIAPVCLILPEAGGRITDLRGEDLRFDFETVPCDRSYTILGASPRLHGQLLRCLA
jgi:myo-inositol-1(or 4)-monophosphatase